MVKGQIENQCDQEQKQHDRGNTDQFLVKFRLIFRRIRSYLTAVLRFILPPRNMRLLHDILQPPAVLLHAFFSASA